MDQFNPRYDTQKINEAYEKILEKKSYKDFFQSMLKKYGVKEPDQLPKNKRKKFYDEVDAGWKGKKETD